MTDMDHRVFRKIDPSPFFAMIGEPVKDSLGAVPMLQWIEISDLVIDPAYQREIHRSGARNVSRIAREFDWPKFAPVIVAPVDGGRYAIVDGQHRTTAAAARGVTSVPCQVIIVDLADQAAAFAAINGNVTKMSAMQIHAARVAAGDEAARELESVCASAGVRICRYPIPADKMKPGDTLAVTVLSKQMKTFGGEVLGVALRCILNSKGGSVVMLRPATIEAFCQVFDAEPAWMARETFVTSSLASFDLPTVYDRAMETSKRRKIGAVPALVNEIYGFLEKKLVG